MKFFIIGRFRTADTEYIPVRELLLSRGHQLSYDWYEAVNGNKRKMNTSDLTDAVEKDMNGLAKSDIVICIASDGYDTHVELGGAIALGKEIWLFGKEGDLTTLSSYYCHPRVKRFFINESAEMPYALLGLLSTVLDKWEASREKENG